MNNRSDHHFTLFLQFLHSLTPAKQLQYYFSMINSPKNHTKKVFIEGVTAFSKIANMHVNEREVFFGSKFGGVHYPEDLHELWMNSRCESPLLTDEDLPFFPPSEWEKYNNAFYYVYHGNKPAEALDTLLQGPTLIDCGLFYELSLWFGIRYMLGNEIFNSLFGCAPFSVGNLQDPKHINWLDEFHAKDLTLSEHVVGLRYFANHKIYILKHPGGHSIGENCLMINGTYTIFEPNVPKNSNLTISELDSFLRNALNDPQDFYDKQRLLDFSKYPDAEDSIFKFTYGDLFILGKEYESFELDEKTWKTEQPDRSESVQFDFNRFVEWIERTCKKISEQDTPAKLLFDLNAYINNRRLRGNGITFLGGHPMKQKLAAADTLKKILEGESSEIADSHIPALTQGKLWKFYNRFLQLRPEYQAIKRKKLPSKR